MQPGMIAALSFILPAERSVLNPPASCKPLNRITHLGDVCKAVHAPGRPPPWPTKRLRHLGQPFALLDIGYLKPQYLPPTASYDKEGKQPVEGHSRHHAKIAPLTSAQIAQDAMSAMAAWDRVDTVGATSNPMLAIRHGSGCTPQRNRRPTAELLDDSYDDANTPRLSRGRS
jgi:hypothetical protein